MLIKKRKIIVSITLIIIALASFTVYMLKSGSESFALLNIESVENVNDPVLKTAIEATKECNKIGKKYRIDCYTDIAWELGYYNEPSICEKLKEELKPDCYQGYGRKIGEKYSPDIEKIKNECSKVSLYEDCLYDAALEIGKDLSNYIETEQCKKFEQENAKRRCCEGIGRQLGEDNQQLDLCKKTEYKEVCFRGFAYKIDAKNREEALQICQNLNDTKCYIYIGINTYLVYNQSIRESFKDCEQYPYPEDCKQGVAFGVAHKFFQENQQEI